MDIRDDLGNAFVIEKRRRPVCRHEDRYAGPQHEGFRMVDLKTEAAYQFHSKGTETALFSGTRKAFSKCSVVMSMARKQVTPLDTSIVYTESRDHANDGYRLCRPA